MQKKEPAEIACMSSDNQNPNASVCHSCAQLYSASGLKKKKQLSSIRSEWNQEYIQ